MRNLVPLPAVPGSTDRAIMSTDDGFTGLDCGAFIPTTTLLRSSPDYPNGMQVSPEQPQQCRSPDVYLPSVSYDHE